MIGTEHKISDIFDANEHEQQIHDVALELEEEEEIRELFVAGFESDAVSKFCGSAVLDAILLEDLPQDGVIV